MLHATDTHQNLSMLSKLSYPISTLILWVIKYKHVPAPLVVLDSHDTEHSKSTTGVISPAVTETSSSLQQLEV